MRVWTPAFQHQFLDGNLLNFNAPPGAEPNVAFEAPLVRPAPLPSERGFPVRRGNRFACVFPADAFTEVIGADIKLDLSFPPGTTAGQLSGNVVLGNDAIRMPVAFASGAARLQFRIVDNQHVIAVSVPFDALAPLQIQARWHTHGQAQLWVNGVLRRYHPAIAAGLSFPIDRIAFGHHDTSGFAPGAPAFLIRRLSVKLLRRNDAARFVDQLFPIEEPAALDEGCRRKLRAVDADASRAMRAFMTQAIGRLTRSWEAPQPGGPFSADAVAAHEAAVAAARAFAAFMANRPGADAATVKARIKEFLIVIQATDPAGYAQAVAGLEQIAGRYDAACLAQLQPAAQPHAAALQPLAALLQDVWTTIQSPGGPNG